MRLLTLTIFLCSCLLLKAQVDSISTQNIDFKLKNGVYLSMQQLKENNPQFRFQDLRLAPDTSTFTDFDPYNQSYLFPSDSGGYTALAPENIFAFVANSVCYLKIIYSDELYFARSVNPGSLWQFATVVTTYSRSMSFDPYFPSTYNQTESKDLFQVILDLEHEEIFPMNYEKVLPMLMEDNGVARLMDGKSKRKQKKMLVFYLRKYNENNPAFFPK